MSMVLFNCVEVKHSPSFGRGILPFVGQYDGVQPYTQADLQAAAQLYGEMEDARRSTLRTPEGPGDDYGFELERIARQEIEELCRMRNRNSSLCRGFSLSRFGHDCTSPRRSIRDECIDVVISETRAISGEILSRAEASRRYDAMLRSTFAR
jgi:hypothetical protein